MPDKRIFLVLLLLLPGLSHAAENFLAVADVLNGKSLTLATGDTVRLAAIEAPNTPRTLPSGLHQDGEPLGEEARAALTALVAGKRIRIEEVGGGRDRHNRLLGQAFREDGLWVQGELLKEGWAMVYSFRDDAPELIHKMLAAEHEAQAAKRGIWANPYFRIVTPQEAEQFVGRFRLVEGKVVSVHEYHGHMYINFSEPWRGRFAVFISRKYMEAFAALNLPTLVGKTIRVRGWIHYHNAAMIDLDHPEQIEVE